MTIYHNKTYLRLTNKLMNCFWNLPFNILRLQLTLGGRNCTKLNQGLGGLLNYGDGC